MEQYRGFCGIWSFLRAQIERVDSNFNMTTDEDLVESYIYESMRLPPGIVFCCGRQRNKNPVWETRNSPVGITGDENADMGCMLPGNFDVYFVWKNREGRFAAF